MSKVTQVHRATGSFELNFDGLPQELIDQLDELGHVVVTQVREDGPSIGDGLLTASRYVGVVIGRRKEKVGAGFTLLGDGMAWWLGTEENAGAVYETAKTYSGATFSAVVTDLLPPAVTPGTLTNTGLPTYTGTQIYQAPREALDYVCDTVGAEWRVNGNGTLDAGPASAVFASGRALIVRRAQDAGEDMTLRAFPGPAQTDRDLEDFRTRIVVLGEVDGTSVVQGSWDISGGLNPYKDIHGNPVQLTQLVSESSTEGVNANARAAAIGAQSGPQRAIILDTSDYDMRGVIEVGDTVWIHDPEAGLEDPANEVQFRGQRLNPVAEQVTTISWPVTTEMGVYYRSRLGAWLDLSPWLVPSGDTTSVEVGKNKRDLVSSASSPVGRVPTPDTSIPGVPVFVTPFKASTYQQGDTGVTKAQVQVAWSAVAFNTDSSPFQDGSHYEIRYRPSTSPLYPATYAQAAAAGTYAGLGTWGTPITQTFSDWSTQYAPIDATTALVTELSPGTPYEFGIRALDSATPPNAGAWSSTYTQYTPVDVDPPADPAAAVVAGSKIAVLVKHYLGASTGGTFNLALDLARLRVHIGLSSTFTEDNRPIGEGGTYAGAITATRAQILGQIPVVGTFQVDTTSPLWVKVVAEDIAGNRSGASAAAPVTAQLIDSQWISDLTADKITSGTVMASIILGGEIATGTTGQRVRFGFDGIEAFLSDGVTKFFDLDIATQTLTAIGTLQSAQSGVRWVMHPDGTLRLYGTGAAYAQLFNYNTGNDIVMRGRDDANSRAGRINAGPVGAGMVFAAESEIPNTYGTQAAVFESYSILRGPLVDLVAESTYGTTPGDGDGRRIQFRVTTEVTSGASKLQYVYAGSGGSGESTRLRHGVHDVSVVWRPGVILIRNAVDGAYQPINASAFNVSSSETTKVEVRPVRGLLDPLATIAAAPSRAWKYRDEVAKDGAAAPTRLGPILEQLPPVLQRASVIEGDQGLVDLGSMIGLALAGINQLRAQRVTSTTASAVVPNGVKLQPGAQQEVPVTWESSPLAPPEDALCFVNPGLLGPGQVTAWIKPGSVTATGCVVVFQNKTTAVITSIAVPSAPSLTSVSATVIGQALYTPATVDY